MIFDTHCHLNSEELYSRLDEVIDAAQKVGVTKFLVVGWDKKSSLLAIDLANRYDFMYAAIGFHPTEINNLNDDDFNEVMSHLDDSKVVALGEIGLDYYWVKDEKMRELQRFYFKKQIKIANLHHKPISIHNRDAFKDCLDVLKECRPEYGGIMHCYSGSVESMKEVLQLGLYIGLGGPLTFKNAKTPKEVCQNVPLERLVVETDCPYLAPHPLRGTINEPKNIDLVVDEISKIRNIRKDEISARIYKNSCELFHV